MDAPLDSRCFEDLDPRRPLRVAFVIDAVAPWSKGGRETRNQELFARLPAHDIDLTVYTMRWWRERPSGAVRFRAIMPRIDMYRGDRRSMLHAFTFAIACVLLLFEPFDVLCADHMPGPQLFSLRAVAWLRNRRLVVDWHEFWGEQYWCEYLGRLGRLAARFERAQLRMPDRIVPGTQRLAAELTRHGVRADRVSVVPYAVNRKTLENVDHAGSSPDLIVVGRLLAHKRVGLAIETFSRVGERRTGLTMGIIGDGPARAELEELARRLGLDDRITFMGQLPEQSAVWSLVAGSKAMLFLSEREGFGLAVAESLALGTPVICIEGPSNAACELVDDGFTGSVVPSADPSLMASAVEFWLDSAVQRGEVASRFWASHRSLDWDRSAQLYADVLWALGSREHDR